jgi:hypothetical protein
MAYVQGIAEAAVSNTSTPTLTGVTSGHALIVSISQSSNAATRSYTVTSDVDGAFPSPAVEYKPGRQIRHYIMHGVTAGDHTVTVTADGATSFLVVLTEWSGLDPLATPITGTFADASDTNTHYCAEAGDIDTAGPCAIVACGALNSVTGVTSVDPSAGYTEIAIGSAISFFMYKDAAAAVTDDRGEWTHAGTARTGYAAMAAFPYVVASPPADRVYPRITRRRMPGGLL